MNSLSKEALEELSKIKGKVRGVVFQTDKEYVLSHFKEEGLKKLQENAKNLGLKIPYQDAETMDWYPLWWRIASLLLIKETFALEEKDIRAIGEMAPKVSFIVKFFFKLFTPLEKFSKEIPRYWREHYTVGDLEVSKVSEKEKIMVLDLKDAKIHPLLCKYLEGYFERVMKFLYPETLVKETKCPFKGDAFHEYTFTW